MKRLDVPGRANLDRLKEGIKVILQRLNICVTEVREIDLRHIIQDVYERLTEVDPESMFNEKIYELEQQFQSLPKRIIQNQYEVHGTPLGEEIQINMSEAIRLNSFDLIYDFMIRLSQLRSDKLNSMIWFCYGIIMTLETETPFLTEEEKSQINKLLSRLGFFSS